MEISSVVQVVGLKEHPASSIVETTMLLHCVPVGKKGRVQSLLCRGIERRRFLDLGLIPGSIITVERTSPAGNPIAYNIRGAVMALRNEEAQNVVVTLLKG